jgi:hypothetical protein
MMVLWSLVSAVENNYGILESVEWRVAMMFEFVSH